MIDLPAVAFDDMIAHAQANLPNEACGLVALSDNKVQRVYCVENVTPSPDTFTVDPVAHHDAIRDADAMGWEVGGSFHSHPNGNAEPSQTDVAKSPGSEWLHIIVGLGATEPTIGFYRIGTRVSRCRFQIAG
ncbi:MAG: hypothetical protein GEU79_12100 [Acidimicrobiia bacterium]|nr:hypothetical protein [Acidimicrobiia bacterium]